MASFKIDKSIIIKIKPKIKGIKSAPICNNLREKKLNTKRCIFRQMKCLFNEKETMNLCVRKIKSAQIC